jgi:AraC-like DNA-binding protein
MSAQTPVNAMTPQNDTNSSHAKAPSPARFIETLGECDLFRAYQQAFHTLTGLPLGLRAQGDEEFIEEVVTSRSVSGVVRSLVPVRLGKTPLAVLVTGGVRLEAACAETFAPLAAALLDEDRSAAEIRGAQVEFHQVPVMSPQRYQAALSVLASFAAQLGESAHRQLFARTTHEPQAVRQAKIFIHAHLAESMTLEAVAAAVHVSPFHFCKIFKRATGLTFTDFVNRARVEKARRMLMRPDARITEVAYEVGFQSLSHFNRSFRRIANESPTQYRARMRGDGHGVMA